LTVEDGAALGAENRHAPLNFNIADLYRFRKPLNDFNSPDR
jgi:hypothetical protein